MISNIDARPLNFAIIGCGRIAPRHAQAIQNIPEAKLIAVCDIIKSRAEYFANEYSAIPYLDYRKLLERKDIDIVNVCVPSGLHVDIGIDAARAGKHVIIEKPIALSLESADALIQVCQEEGVTLCVVLQNRFNPPMQDLHELTKAGKLGALLLGSATVRWYRPQQYYEDEWHGSWAMDGGVLLNQAIHHIDALNWIMGEVRSVFAYTDTLAHKIETPDVAVATLKFKNGALATIEASTVTYPKNIEGSIAVFGKLGSVKVGGTALNRKVFWKIEGQLELESDILAKEAIDPPSVYGYSHQEQIEEMVKSIHEKRPPLTSGEEARKSLRLVLSIHESARTGKEIFLDDEQP